MNEKTRISNQASLDPANLSIDPTVPIGRRRITVWDMEEGTCDGCGHEGTVYPIYIGRARFNRDHGKIEVMLCRICLKELSDQLPMVTT